MAGNENQKRKLLELARLFVTKSDEQHRLSMRDIISYLENNGIAAERKGIYRDIQVLCEAGMDICRDRGYYLASRNFELAELKLLADAIAASRSVSSKKSLSIIKKLQGLASVYQARELNRSVYVSGRAKTENEALIYNVDALHRAINEGKRISFIYYEYAPDKTLKARRNGERYEVSPYLLSWDNENYYLVAHHERYDALSNFRVDKMKDIRITDKDVHKTEVDVRKHAVKTVGMFAGEAIKVELEIPSSKMGVVIDRFGRDIFTSEVSGDRSRVFLNVAPSPVFYSWVFMLGESRVVYPESARREYVDMLQRAVKAAEEE